MSEVTPDFSCADFGMPTAAGETKVRLLAKKVVRMVHTGKTSSTIALAISQGRYDIAQKHPQALNTQARHQLSKLIECAYLDRLRDPKDAREATDLVFSLLV